MNMKHNYFGIKMYFGMVGVCALTLAMLCMPVANAQSAGTSQNQLQSIVATKLTGDRVQLELKLSGPAPKPLTFTVNQPARLALDLNDTGLAVKNRKTDVSVGAVNSVVAAEAGGRTRVVVNLSTLVPYNVLTKGDTVYVILGSGPNDTAVAAANASSFGPPSITPQTKSAAPAVAASAAAAPSSASPAATQAIAQTSGTSGKTLTAVDFRRGSGGTAQIVVDLSDPSIIGNVHTQGGNIIVDFASTHLPAKFVRRMDVTDFATPVQYIDAENTASGARLVIHPTGKYDKLAYQSDNTFSVEVKPVAQQALAQTTGGLGGKTFKGQKISLNFQNIDIRAVLQILADASGKNIVVSDSVRGNITLRLQDVPWDEALDIILHSKGLAARQYGNVMMIGTATEMAAQEAAESAAQAAEPLESAFIQINYAKASDMAALLQKNSSLFPKRASVTVDTRTNTLLIQNTAANLDEIRQMIAKLDVPVKQVLIESRIVIANNDFNSALGVKFGATGARAINGNNGLIAVTGDSTGANTMINSAISNIAATGQQFPVSLPSLNDQLNVNSPATGAAGQIGLAILKNNYLINLELSALQAEGKGEVVSSPRVITANQNKAHIEQGVQIPYQQASSSGATTVSFKNAVLSLDVTPQITPDDRIIMDLDVHKDSVGQNVPTGTGGTIPSIDTRDVQTQVLVNNGDTVVLGGVYETTKNTSISKVPLLGDIPLLGWLFRSTTTTNNKDELLIFVTPKILMDQSGTGSVTD